MPWNDYPLRTLVIPGDAGPTAAKIIIDGTGTNPILVGSGQLAGILYEDGSGINYVSSIETGGKYHLSTNDNTGLVLLQQMDAVTNADQSGQQKLLDAHLVVSIDAGRKNHQVVLWGNVEPTAPGGTDDGDVSLMGISMARGYRDGNFDVVNSAAIGAETVMYTFTNFVFRDGRVYRFWFGGRMAASAAGIGAVFKVRKTNLAGAVVIDLGAIPTQNPNQATISVEGYIARTAGTGDLTQTVVVTLTSTAGTVTWTGGAQSPRGVMIEDVGAEGPWFGPSTFI
jgi:hypothetical protein